jgi:hypothetical protein
LIGNELFLHFHVGFDFDFDLLSDIICVVFKVNDESDECQEDNNECEAHQSVRENEMIKLIELDAEVEESNHCQNEDVHQMVEDNRHFMYQ